MKLKISWVIFLSGFFMLTFVLLLAFILGDLTLLKDLYGDSSPGQVYTELIIWGASPREIADILHYLYNDQQNKTFLKTLTRREQDYADKIAETIAFEKLLDGRIYQGQLKRLPFVSFGRFQAMIQGFGEGLSLGFFRGAVEYRTKYPMFHRSYQIFGIIITLWLMGCVLRSISKLYRRLCGKIKIPNNQK